MASEISEIVYAFGPQLNAFMAVGILLKYFRRKLLQFEWRQMSAEFRYVRLYIADQVEFPEFRCSFYKNFTLLHSKFTYEKD